MKLVEGVKDSCEATAKVANLETLNEAVARDVFGTQTSPRTRRTFTFDMGDGERFTASAVGVSVDGFRMGRATRRTVPRLTKREKCAFVRLFPSVTRLRFAFPYAARVDVKTSHPRIAHMKRASPIWNAQYPTHRGISVVTFFISSILFVHNHTHASIVTVADAARAALLTALARREKEASFKSVPATVPKTVAHR